ncbi:anaphase-promoting complex subunit cdc27 [Coelomomyces lativittatus]|nr:anaphase-promoting complex subunit cdc27 [Coelomomyces lativittatus]
MTCFDQALKCNPWLWTAYESLCQLGSTTHPETYFHHVPSLSSTTLVSPRPPPTKRQKRSASPVPSPSSSFLSSYAHVTSLLHQSKYGEAHQALTKLPTDTFTLLYSALLLFEQRKYPSSQVMFETLYRHSPWCLHGIDVYSTCLWFLQWEGKLAQLAHHLKSVAPLANETWVVVGNYASVKRFHPHAITCFQRAIQLTKNAHYAFTLLGHEYLTVKEIDNAIHAFRQAIHFHPRSYNAWHGLGTCYQETDQLDLALYHYQKAAELHPCSVLISYIGNVYHAKGNELRAIEMYDQAIQLDSDNPVPQFAKATALVRLNRCEESLPILLDLRRLRPMELNVLCLLGWVYFQLGKKNEALRSFLEAYATCHADKVPVFLRELVSEVQALEPTGEWEDLDHLLHAIGISEGTKLRF